MCSLFCSVTRFLAALGLFRLRQSAVAVPTLSMLAGDSAAPKAPGSMVKAAWAQAVFKIRPMQLEIRIKYLNVSAGKSVDGFGGCFHIPTNGTRITTPDFCQMILLNGMQIDEP